MPDLSRILGAMAQPSVDHLLAASNPLIPVGQRDQSVAGFREYLRHSGIESKVRTPEELALVCATLDFIVTCIGQIGLAHPAHGPAGGRFAITVTTVLAGLMQELGYVPGDATTDAGDQRPE